MMENFDSVICWMNDNQGFADWISSFFTLSAVIVTLFLARRSETVIEKRRYKENRENVYYSVMQALSEFNTEVDQFSVKGGHQFHEDSLNKLKLGNELDVKMKKYLELLESFTSKWRNDWRLTTLVKEILTEKESKDFLSIIQNDLSSKFESLKTVQFPADISRICVNDKSENSIVSDINKLRNIILSSNYLSKQKNK